MVTKEKGGGGGGRIELRGCDEHIHTPMYTIDQQQGPTAQHGGSSIIFYNSLYG